MVTIVGVMPASFGFPNSARLWTPMRVNPATIQPGEGPPIRMFGRLTPGVTLAKAQAELESIANVQGKRALVKPYVESFWAYSESYWQVVALYSFNVFFIALLGICAANVATLIFARTATRETEITVRTALGAGRSRIVAQLVAEAAVLTSVAAAIGLGVAGFALRQIRVVWESVQNQPFPFWWNEQLGGETIAYTLLLVVLASLLIGGVPALKATGARMHDRLNSTRGSMKFGKLWTGVIVAQVAVTVVFLMTLVSLGWGLIEQRQQYSDLTFPMNEYMAGRLALDEGVSPERMKKVLAEFHRRLSEDPTVINAAYAVHLPGNGNRFSVEFPTGNAAKPPVVRSARVGFNYFTAFQQPLIAGRIFTPAEIDSAANVAVVDETFVRLVFGGGNAIGQLVRNTNIPDSPWCEIVGVVRDISTAPQKTVAAATIYLPVATAGQWSMHIVLHTRSSDAAAKLRAAATATDRQLRLTDVMTIDRLAATEAQTLNFFTSALGIVAAVALMLSTAGIYALISFTLARRTREIGIRTALGAGPVRIITGMLSPAFLQVVGGVVLGAIPGVLIIANETQGTSSLTSWPTIAATLGVASFVIGVAMLSCIVPVRRALRIHPNDALRIT
jgi:predicted permease